ncbi:MAG: hypothetical protein N2234_00655 [Planctomycetota bacterium]|nr:hypothetical protein [Planctomycetota bacterium]
MEKEETLIWGKFHNWRNMKIFQSATLSEMKEALDTLLECDIGLAKAFCSFFAECKGDTSAFHKVEIYCEPPQYPDMCEVESMIGNYLFGRREVFHKKWKFHEKFYEEVFDECEGAFVHSYWWNEQIGNGIWNADDVIDYILSLNKKREQIMKELDRDEYAGMLQFGDNLVGIAGMLQFGDNLVGIKVLVLDPRLPDEDQQRLQKELSGIVAVCDEEEFIKRYIEPERYEQVKKDWIKEREEALRYFLKENPLTKAVWTLCEGQARIMWVEERLKDVDKFFALERYSDVLLGTRQIVEEIFKLMLGEKKGFFVDTKAINEAKAKIGAEYSEPIFYDVLNVWRNASPEIHKPSIDKETLAFKASDLLGRTHHLWNTYKYKNFGMYGIELVQCS